MSVVVVSRIQNPNELVGVQTSDGKRMVVQAGSAVPLGAQSGTIDLLTRGHGGMPPQVVKLATVANGRVSPLLGVAAPASVSTVQLGKMTLVLVEASQGHHGTLHQRSPCHLVGCYPTTPGGPMTPAVAGPGGHCLCNGKEIDPLGWAALFGADAPSSSLGLPPVIIGPGGGGQQYRPNVPSAQPVAYTENVQPCHLVLNESMLLGGQPQTLAQCLAPYQHGGALQPEPTPSPYATAMASGAMAGSTNDVINPFALDALY